MMVVRINSNPLELSNSNNVFSKASKPFEVGTVGLQVRKLSFLFRYCRRC